jgi:hypothetical protein
MNYYVEIVETDTDKVEKRMGPHTKQMANRIEDGVNINLNHEKYFTRVVEEEDKP